MGEKKEYRLTVFWCKVQPSLFNYSINIQSTRERCQTCPRKWSLLTRVAILFAIYRSLALGYQPPPWLSVGFQVIASAGLHIIFLINTFNLLGHITKVQVLIDTIVISKGFNCHWGNCVVLKRIFEEEHHDRIPLGQQIGGTWANNNLITPIWSLQHCHIDFIMSIIKIRGTCERDTQSWLLFGSQNIKHFHRSELGRIFKCASFLFEYIIIVIIYLHS